MKKTLRLVTVLLSGILLMGSTLAYFTDHVTTTKHGTAGTVSIQLNNMVDMLDEEGYDILGPGDMRSAKLELVNMGNKSIDVRTTLAITVKSENYDLAFSGDVNTQSEYDLYHKDDVKFVEGYGYMPKEGAVPIQVKTVSDNVIYYEIPEYSLNGNSAKYSEVETVNGVGNYSYIYDYVLIFKHDTGNEWQDSVISMDIVAEAKQHENTGAGWEIIAKETVKQGSIEKQVAVSENVITN